jgi:hypothetical protein
MIDETSGPLGGGEGDEDEDAPERDDHERSRLLERAVPDVIRRVVERAVESGVERLSEGPENLRQRLGDLKLPKDALHFIYGQIDDTKKGLYRVVAKEIRDVLEHTNFADEISQVLTKLSFEITTQIRFVPNPEAHKASGAPGEQSATGSEPAEGADPADPGPSATRSSSLPRPHVVSRVAMKARERLGRPTKQ